MTGELPQGWAVAKLEQLVSPDGLMTDGDWVESKDQDPSGDVRLLQLADVGVGEFRDRSNRFLTSSKAKDLNCTFLQPGDVLIARLGDVLGKACLAPKLPQPSVTVVDVHVFRSGHPDVSHRWLMHLFNAQATQRALEDLSSGTTRKRVTGQKLKDLEVRVPPAKEQQRIVSRIEELFSEIDEGERALERVGRLVERYRQSVLKAAVTGELTREWRERRNTTGADTGEALLRRILDGRRSVWEESERARLAARGDVSRGDAWKARYRQPMPPITEGLPDLPKGWVWASPNQLEAWTSNALTIGPFGSDLKVSDYRSEGVPLIFVRNIRSRDFGGRAAKYVDPAKAADLSSHTAHGGDLLITKMGDPPGDACVYPAGLPDAVITADCIKWTLAPPLPSPAFFEAFINSTIGRSQFKSITKGVAQQKVTLDAFRQLAIALPGADEQLEIERRLALELSRLREVGEWLSRERRRGAALRQSILKAAFSGQLVPQDPRDEPASALLARLAAQAAAAPAAPRRRGARRTADA